MLDSRSQLIRDNLARVKERIEAAAARSGRGPEQVRLVAVTKYVDWKTTSLLLDAGCIDLGESRPQALWDKANEAQASRVQWHLIGHLQRNKVRRSLPLAHLIHSVDSERLLRQIEADAADLGLTVQLLLEVNISGDSQKHGFRPDEIEAQLDVVTQLAHIRVQGLMGMGSLKGGVSQARRDFAQLRELRDQLVAVCPAEVSLNELSMGMSNDFDVAIEEGATIVRVGSTLFAGLED